MGRNGFKLLRWLGRHELAILLGLLIVVSAVWGFIELADEVLEGEAQAFDHWVMQSLRKADQPAVPVGPHWMMEVNRDITALGGVTVLALVTAAVTGFLLLAGRFTAAGFILAATLTGWLLSSLLKAVFARPRPELVPHLVEVYSASFPSGHSMMSAVVYLTLASLLARLVAPYRLKLYLLAVALVLTALIGVSRVYLGVHYPTDVLAGWAAGLAWATLCWLAAQVLRYRNVVQQEV